MKRSLENCDLTEGHGDTKAWKSLEFDCEDGGATGTVESASGWRRKSSWNSEINHAKKTTRESREAKEEKSRNVWGIRPTAKLAQGLSAAGFSCDILFLTSKHCPLEESEPTAQFPDQVLVLYPSEKQTYDHQTGPFHPVRLVVQANSTWNAVSNILAQCRRVALQRQVRTETTIDTGNWWDLHGRSKPWSCLN